MKMMRPALSLLPLFLLLIVGIVESRKDLGEYWKLVMKQQDMPQEIQGLLNQNPKKNFKTLKQFFDDGKKKKVVKDFEQRPNISAYGKKNVDVKEKNGTIKDFEPRPNISAYGNNEIDDESMKDVEPIPSLTKYDA
ncbi:hypothetical protein KIW84_050215 [Lathyrus oleraceus]|uniref:Uncharacterized protein n=1 Tax=Pisum sativum TaxID=3888 RepID=A0A9D4WIS5_PEA|nr:hypothetical protein KIW84_050215 [Pisum sativum]